MPMLPRGRDGSLPESAATPEHLFRGRRRFLEQVAGIAAGALANDRAGDTGPLRLTLDRPLTDPRAAARCNPFLEYGRDKEAVWQLAAAARPESSTVEIGGLCRNRGRWDLDTLRRRFPVTERVYRFRCVEGWAMAVPWLGFPLASLVRQADPRGHATHVRFVSAGPRPYCEGLRLPEAVNDLTLLACGVYGRPLPMQHGAPLRLVVPWKYGLKSIKAVARIEFTDREPATTWSSAAPGEYDFLANVDPEVSHARWSQARERMLGTGELRDTIRFNGYGDWVAGLYG